MSVKLEELELIVIQYDRGDIHLHLHSQAGLEESKPFGTDLMGAIIEVNQIKFDLIKLYGCWDEVIFDFEGFPNIHPNQTTLNVT